MGRCPQLPRRPRKADNAYNFGVALWKWERRRLLFRLIQAAHAAKRYGIVWPKDDRERTFCHLYVFFCIQKWNAGRFGVYSQRKAAADAVRTAGYKNLGGAPAEAGRRGMEMIQKPRNQREITKIWDALGLDVSACGAVLKRILDTALEPDGVVTPDHHIKAVALVLNATVGMAPTKSATVHANVPVDGFFSPEEFGNTPPIATAKQEPKNVTPTATKKRR